MKLSKTSAYAVLFLTFISIFSGVHAADAGQQLARRRRPRSNSFSDGSVVVVVKPLARRASSKSFGSLADLKEQDSNSPTTVTAQLSGSPVMFSLGDRKEAMYSLLPPQFAWEKAVLEESNHDGSNPRADGLFDQKGIEVDRTDEWGDTLLHRVVRNQKIGAIRCLLRMGASLTIKNEEQYDPQQCLGVYDSAIDIGGCVDIDAYKQKGESDDDAAWGRYYAEQEVILGLFCKVMALEQIICKETSPEGVNSLVDKMCQENNIHPRSCYSRAMLNDIIATGCVGAVLYFVRHGVLCGIPFGKKSNFSKVQLATMAGALFPFE